MIHQTFKNRKNGILVIIGMLLFIGIGLIFFSSHIAYASWVEEEEGVGYLQEDGQYAVGFLDIEDERYYFDTDGHLVTGKFYVEDEDAYYYSDESGILQFGVIQTKNDFFITDENGRLIRGFAEYEGKRYFFNDIAQLVVGWFKQNGNWYYADSAGVIMTGFITVDNYRYYLNADGSRVSDTVLEIDGVTYIFNKDGSIDENATTLYPVFVCMNQIRQQNGCESLIMNSKVQSCAILRATELVNGFTANTTSIESLLANRGVLCSGGFEFSYGGLENYDINRLMTDMQKDINLLNVLTNSAVTEAGLGVHVQDGIFYYDFIFIEGK